MESLNAQLQNMSLDGSLSVAHREQLIQATTLSTIRMESFEQLRERYESALLSPFLPNELKVELLNFLFKCDFGMPCELLLKDAAKLDIKILQSLRLN